MASKDLITCHVLDTLTGHPAAGVRVDLVLIDDKKADVPTENIFRATTNSDGRITNWEKDSHLPGVDEILHRPEQSSTRSIWKLRFYTGLYYGEHNTFWPVVELIFFVKPGEHYHVPLLLGPYSYTTYRGS